MLKIDTHLHLALHPVPANPMGKISSYTEMLPHLAELGISKGILMSGGEMPGLPFGSNADVRAIAQADPVHYAWMCNLDFNSPETVRRRLTEYKRQGAVGIGELMINRRLDDPFLREVFAAAGDLGLPVTFHMSPEVGFGYGVVDDARLPLLEQCLRDFPSTLFVGHSQSFWIEMSGDAPSDRDGRNQWGKGPVLPGGRIPELFSKYSNLYGDLSANSAGQAIMRDPDFGLAFLERYSDRLFFATDMLNTDMVFPLGGWLDEQADAGKLSRTAYEKICRGNAEKIYGI